MIECSECRVWRFMWRVSDPCRAVEPRRDPALWPGLAVLRQIPDPAETRGGALSLRRGARDALWRGAGEALRRAPRPTLPGRHTRVTRIAFVAWRSRVP